MIVVPLTHGKTCKVDDLEWDFLSQFHWGAWQHRAGQFYARTTLIVLGKTNIILMHRLLTGAMPGEKVDHWNHDTLDNQRVNLRVCSQSGNIANSRLSVMSTSGFKGVALDERDGKWMAYIGSQSTRQYLGRFITPELAAAAYDQAAIARWGQFARTNASLGLL